MNITHSLRSLGVARRALFEAADTPLSPLDFVNRAAYASKSEDIVHQCLGFNVYALTDQQRDAIHDALIPHVFNLGAQGMSAAGIRRLLDMFDNTLTPFRYLKDEKAQRSHDSNWRIIQARDLDHAVDIAIEHGMKPCDDPFSRFEVMETSGRWVQA